MLDNRLFVVEFESSYRMWERVDVVGFMEAKQVAKAKAKGCGMSSIYLNQVRIERVYA